MTPSELKQNVKAKTDSVFFARSSMKFFGDSMKNYGVCSAKFDSSYDTDGNYNNGKKVIIDAWELYRKNPVKHGLKNSAYFDKLTFKKVSP